MRKVEHILTLQFSSEKWTLFFLYIRSYFRFNETLCAYLGTEINAVRQKHEAKRNLRSTFNINKGCSRPLARRRLRYFSVGTQQNIENKHNLKKCLHLDANRSASGFYFVTSFTFFSRILVEWSLYRLLQLMQPQTNNKKTKTQL